MAVLTKEELLRRAPSDIVEETIEVPEWLSADEREQLEKAKRAGDEEAVDVPQVRVKSLTSGQQAAITKICVRFGDGQTDLDVPQMQVMQVMDGLVEPQMTMKEVRALQAKSGAGFQRILNWITERSGFDEEKAKDAVARFPAPPEGSDEAADADVPGPSDGPVAG